MIFLPVIKSHYNRIPSPIKEFLARGLVIFILWKIVYLFFLLPDRVVDKPLTDTTAHFSARLLSFFINAKAGYSSDYASIFINDDKAVNIADPCNALILFVVYLGFIIAFPASIKKKVLFALGGVLTIFVLNVLRCATLAVVANKYLYIVDHHFVYNLFVYAIIFVLWYLFTKKALNEEA